MAKFSKLQVLSVMAETGMVPVFITRTLTLQKMY